MSLELLAEDEILSQRFELPNECVKLRLEPKDLTGKVRLILSEGLGGAGIIRFVFCGNADSTLEDTDYRTLFELYNGSLEDAKRMYQEYSKLISSGKAMVVVNVNPANLKEVYLSLDKTA